MDVDGGWEQWQWDETLFAGTAGYYVRGRLPYAEGLADGLSDALTLDGRGRLLDVGCGPGTVTLRLAHLFEHVIGLDADGDMLNEAARQAEQRGMANATWVRRRAEELPGGLGVFRVVAFAASFHWMDRPKVARAVRTMLEPGGAAVQIDAPAYRPEDPAKASSPAPLPYPPPPDDAIVALRRRYLGADLRAGQGIRNSSPGNEDAVFRAAGFATMRRIVVPDGRTLTRTTDDVVAQRLSSSSSAPHLFGHRLAAFEADLRHLLGAASPAGLFSVRLPDNVISIWAVGDQPG